MSGCLMCPQHTQVQDPVRGREQQMDLFGMHEPLSHPAWLRAWFCHTRTSQLHVFRVMSEAMSIE